MSAEIFNLPEPRTIVDRVYLPQVGEEVLVPYFLVPVSAGFPSPAEDYIEGQINFNELLMRNPLTTYVLGVTGDSMKDAHIIPGCKLVVDCSLEARDGSIVIAALDGELTVKRLRIKGKRTFLVPENSRYEPIEITNEMDAVVWGVVIKIILSPEDL